MGLVAVLVSRLPPAPPLGRRAVPSTLTVTHCFSQGLLEAHSTTPPRHAGPLLHIQLVVTSPFSVVT